MIESAFNYSAVNAKIRAWLSYIVKEEEWKSLLEKNVPEIVRFALGKDPVLPKSVENLISFEQALKHRSVIYAEKLMPFLMGEARNFLKHWFKQYEHENVKTILRAIVGGNKIDLLYPLSPKLSKINFDEAKTLSSIDDFESFFSRFDDYKKILSYSISRVRESLNPFYFEVALDVNYYRRLWELTSRLSRRDKFFVKKLIGRQIDVVNVVWIYRAKFFFNMRPEEIIAYVSPYGARFNKKLLDKMLAVESFEEFVEVCMSQKIITKRVEDLNDMDIQLNRELYSEAKNALSGYPFHIGVIIAFFILKRQENLNYVSLVNGKNLGVSLDVLKKFIIF